ncbi:MAG: MFS transporter [Candidatus Lokiarchaeota archaeon]|nr:MFS transporter [Candidatus Lokiarchaeota archaeon]MBD3341899.1 MFS transporter [Candidatus Lokiarchaeota archaeon]
MDDKINLEGGDSPNGDSKYSLSKLISYASMWFADSIILAFFGVVVFYFYEVEVGLNVALVAIAFIFFAIWNMINDPLLGFLTEKPRSEKNVMRYGFRTPLILVSAVLLSIVFFLVFVPPNNTGGTNQITIFLYMLVLVCLMDAFYTIYNSHMAAGTVNMFRKDEERKKVGAIAIIFSVLGVFAVNAVILPNFIVYGDRQSFVLAAGITSIIMLFNVVLFSYGILESKKVKEYYLKGREKEREDKISFMQVIKTSLKSKNFDIFIIDYLFYAIAYNLFYASQVYFYKDVLNVDFGFFMYGILAFFVGFFLGLPIWLKLSNKYAACTIYGIGHVIFGVLFFAFLWITSVYELFFYMFLGGIAYAAGSSVLIWVQADMFDEITAKLGVHQEATLQGITNFFIRLAYLFVGVIIALVHILTNYNPDPLATQIPLAILGVRIHSGLIPGIFLVVGGLGFLMIYDLKGEKKIRMKQQLREIMKD